MGRVQEYSHEESKSVGDDTNYPRGAEGKAVLGNGDGFELGNFSVGYRWLAPKPLMFLRPPKPTVPST